MDVFFTLETAIIFGFAVMGYMLGSIPFGMVFSYMGGYGDIRKIGSGNIGATNVLRTGNKPLAFLTLLCDSGKGAAAILLAKLLLSVYLVDMLPSITMSDVPYGAPVVLLAGFGAVLGHMFPVWIGFNGGKGVATTLGTVLAGAPLLGVTMCAIWLLVAFTMRVSSLSALTAFALAPLIAYFVMGDLGLGIFAGLIALLVFWRHTENIKRLIRGEESKIGDKKKSQGTSQEKTKNSAA